MEKTEMLLVKVLVTSRYFPEGSTITACGPLPPAGVGVVFCDRVPSLAILKSEMVLAWEFATYRKLLSKARPLGEVPTISGVEAAIVMAPVSVLIWSRRTEPWLGKVT